MSGTGSQNSGEVPPGIPPLPSSNQAPKVPSEPPILWLPGESIYKAGFQKVIDASALMAPPQFPFDGRYANIQSTRRIAKHFEKPLGPPTFLLHPLANDGLPLEQIVYRPSLETGIPTLVVTAGLSDLALPGHFPYREFLMTLPHGFPLGMETNENPLHTWPYTVLRKVALYAAVSKKEVWEGNLLPWGSPLYPGSRFQDLFVIGYPDFDLYMMSRDPQVELKIESGMMRNQIDSQNTVFMHRLLPILPDEANYLQQSGPESFHAKLKESGVLWHDLERPSCLSATRPKLPGNLPPIPEVRPATRQPNSPSVDAPKWYRNVDLQSAEFAAQWNDHYAKLETIRFLEENTRHLGSPVHLFHPGRTPKSHKMEILVYSPLNRPTVLMTAGFSDLAFHLPFRMEYAIVLPPNWPIDELSLRQPQFDWPFKTLEIVALYAVMEKKLIELGQTFDPNLPPQYYPGSLKQWFMYFMNPALPPRGRQPETIILQPIPVYQEEFVFLKKHGDEKFLGLLEKEFPEVDQAVGRTAFYDFNRRNIAPKQSWWKW